MAIQITDVIIQDRRLLNESTQGSHIVLLPNNWKQEQKETGPLYASTTISTLKLLKSKGIPAIILDQDNHNISLQDNRSVDWIVPTFLISSMLLSQNPEAVTVALGVIANYVTYIFKGLKQDPNVQFEIVFSKPESSKAHQVRYEGPVSGISELNKVLETVHKSNKN